MTASALMVDYLGHGTHAARPVSPNVVAGVAPVYYEDDTLNTFIWDGSAWVQVNGGGGGSTGYILIQDQKSVGTGGGTFASGAWRTRDMNTIVTDTTGAVTLNNTGAGPGIVLPAGTYRAQIRVPAALVDGHKARLQNTTDATTTLLGTSEYMNVGTEAANTWSVIEGRFTIAGTKTFEVQHQCETTSANAGARGIRSSIDTEIYTTVELTKE